MARAWQRWCVRGALALMPVMVLGGIPNAQAQEGTPAASPVAAAAVHPAHIHEGTCDDLAPAPTYPLEDVRLPEPGETTAAPIGRMAERHEVETSTTTVPVRLDDLLATSYAINVHESPEQIDVYIACGEIVGVVRPHMRGQAPPSLVIPLRELNDSGFAGMAWLEPSGDETIVTVFLAQGLIGRGPMVGRPATSP